METFLSPTSPILILAIICVSIGAAMLGVFMILRRMALVADAFSHVALPGIAAGLLLGFSPAVGAFLMLALGVALIVNLETRRSVAPETTLGVIFTAALAVGLLLIPDEELLESLFGDISRLTVLSASISLAGGILLALLALWQSRQFTLLTLSPELAHASDVVVTRTRLLFFLIVAFAVALGIQFMGVLLMGALIVLPAAIAKNISPNLRVMFVVSGICSVVAAVAGLFFSNHYGWLPGPAVVVVLVILFVISLFTRKD